MTNKPGTDEETIGLALGLRDLSELATQSEVVMDLHELVRRIDTLILKALHLEPTK